MSREDLLNARFRAKMEARTTGQAPVFVEPPKVTAEGSDQAAIDERWRQKLAMRDAQRAPVATLATLAAGADKAPVESEADRKRRERAEERTRKDAEAAKLKADEDAAAKAKADKEAKELEELEKATRPEGTAAAAAAPSGNAPAQK
jgi:hypothetical protein